MANKMTKKDYFTAIMNLGEVKTNPEFVEFLKHEIELLSKKASGVKKLTAQQKANLKIARSIVRLMVAEPERLFTITELQKIVPFLPEDMTNQRLSAIVRTLLPEKDGTGEVERIVDKRKTYFRLNPNYKGTFDLDVDFDEEDFES